MTYNELANEYIKEAIILKNHISYLKKIYAKEIASNVSSICERVERLYDIYLELKCTGNFLKTRSRSNKTND